MEKAETTLAATRGYLGTHSTRRASSILVGLALLVLTALLAAAPAHGAITHKLTSTFDAGGTLSEPGAAAVDTSSGSVYVVTGGFSEAGERIQKFDAAGNPVNFSFLGTSSFTPPCGFPCIRQIAVDNSGGINQGTIYVGVNNNFIYVYRPSGQRAATFAWSHIRRDNPGGGEGYYCGVAVDGSGSLYIEHPAGFFEDGAFTDKFQPGRWKVNPNPPQLWPVAGIFEQPEDSGTCKISVDANQFMYTATGGYQETGTLKRWPMSTINLTSPPSKTIDTDVTSFAADHVNADLYSDKRTQVTRFDPAGEPVEVFGDGDLSDSIGVAVNSHTSTAYVTDRGDNDVKIYSAVTTPDVTNIAPTTGQHTATVSAHVAPSGTATVTDCEIEYGTDTNYGSAAPCSGSSLPYAAGTDVTASISGLDVESVYHYRVRATNANGTTRTIDRTFMTHAVAGVQALLPTDITRTSATLNGSFTGDGDPTTYYFEWGTDTSYGNTTPESLASSAGGTVSASADLSGLDVYRENSPPYHFRLVAKNSVGTTVGPDMTFRTLPPNPPAISNQSASNVSSSSVTLSADINTGLGDTIYVFEYGPTSSYGESTLSSGSIGNDDATHSVSNDISGLTPGVTYHFRVVATNFGGTSHGPDETFSTPDVPAIVETSASGVSQTGATLRASVRAGFMPTTFHFEYGTDTSYGSATPDSQSIGGDNLEHAVSFPLAGLNPGTTYHFRAVASNALGTTASGDQIFTTTPAARQLPRPNTPKNCKRGFVKRHGKCVKKKKKHHRHHRKTGRTHG